MRFLTFIILLLTFTFSKAQTLNPTSSIGDAGTADSFKGGYTFSTLLQVHLGMAL